MKTVAVHLATGFEEIEAITIIDVLRRAGLSVLVVSVTNDYLVNGAHKIPVKADRLFSETDYQSVDMLILPGGMPGAANLDVHEPLKLQIRDFHSSGKPVGAICAAPMVLGHMGMLEGKNAVCYPGFEKELKGARLAYTPTVVDGNLITGRGVGAALNFSLQVVSMLTDHGKAGKLAESLLVDNWE